MNRYIKFLLACCVIFTSMIEAREVLIIQGLSGEPEYKTIFQENIEKWKSACEEANVPCEVLGSESESNYREQLKNRLAEVKEKELWIVLVGHGSFDGRTTKFNIAGEDFTDKDLGEWCRGITGPLVVINTTSSSAPFISELAGKNRTIITATKSANEIFYTRFGTYFAEAISGIEDADLDNDDQVSVLESFIYASNRVAEFYESEGRLATEHALIDDNGDALATRAEWFEGTTATKVAKDGAEPDGLRAMQQVLVLNETEKNFPTELREQRDQLETKVRLLRRQKSELKEEEYYKQLESLLRELAEIYQKAESNDPKEEKVYPVQ